MLPRLQRSRNHLLTKAAALVLAVVLLASSQLAATNEKPLTNGDVVTMVQAGLSQDIVIEKIRSAKNTFDTSPDALVTLKKAGVGGDIIRFMVNPSAGPAAGVSAAPGSGNPSPCQVQAGGQPPWISGASPAMWYSDPDKGDRVEINYEHGTINHVGYGPFGAMLLVLHPQKANVRVTGRTQFLSCINPTDAPLVRFSLDKDERNTSLGKITPFKRTMQISEDDLVPFQFEKTPDGLFKITAKAVLTPGEYGFVPQGNGGFFTLGERVYTFGVD